MRSRYEKGMDTLDRLILAADPYADKAKMLQWREYGEQIGHARLVRHLQEKVANAEGRRQERVEEISKAKQDKRKPATVVTEGKVEHKPPKPPKSLYLKPGMAPTPNCLVRSALFGIVKPGRRRNVEVYEDLPMYGPKGWKVRWRGTQLDQADADLWLCLVRKASVLSKDFLNGQRIVAKTIQVKFTRNGLLREIGRAKGGANRKWLDAALNRLRDCDIQVEDSSGTRRYSAKLLGDRYEDDNSDLEIIEVNANLANLLGKDVSLLDFQKRLDLGKDQLAKWLHGFLGSHKGGQVYSISIEKLHCLADTQMDLLKFKQRVLRALGRIQDVVSGFVVDGDGAKAVLRLSLTPKGNR